MKVRFSIRSKLINLFLVLSLIPLSIVVFMSYKNGKKALQESIGIHMREMAFQTIDMIDRFLFFRKEDIKTWANTRFIQNAKEGDPSGVISENLKRWKHGYGVYSGIFYIDINGNIIASSEPGSIGHDVSGERWFKKAMETANVYISDLEYDPLVGGFAVNLSCPILDPDDNRKVIGLMSSRFNWSEIFEVTNGIRVNEEGQNESGYVLMINRKGSVISGPGFMLFAEIPEEEDEENSGEDEKGISSKNLLSIGYESARLAIEGKKGFLVESDPDGKGWLIGYAGSQGHRDFQGLGWGVLIMQETKEAFKPVLRLRYQFISIGVAIGFLVFVLAIVVSRSISSPIQQLTNATVAISSGDLSQKVNIKSRDEIYILAESFNEMTEKLRETINSRDKEIIERKKAQEKEQLIIKELRKTKEEIAEEKKRLEEANDAIRNLMNNAFSNISARYKNNNLVKCWEVKNCDRKDCQCYESENLRCWQVEGTISTGNQKGKFARKLEDCQLCEVYQHATEDPISSIGEQFNNLMTLLENRAEELKKERMKAEFASQVKSQFLANMSHEIRTPMNAILGFVDLLKNSPLNEQQEDYVETISSSGQILLHIINDILDISKVEAGQLKLEHIDFNLEHLSEDIIGLIKPKLEGKPINLSYHIDEDVPVNLNGDPTRLRQVLINLLSNASKFTDKGEISLEIKMVKRLIGDKRILQFSVKDTGIGISKEVQQQIFEHFTQADMSTTRKYGGTGLGLTICKTYLKEMGGDIWVESEPGQGSKFYFTAEFKESQQIGDKKIYPLSRKELTDKKVLVVDNEEKTRRILKSIFKEFGMVCHELDLKDAFKWLPGIKDKIDLPDVVLMETTIASEKTCQLVSKIKGNPIFKKTKLVALCSTTSIGIADEMQKRGFDAFLPKPITKKSLIGVISTVLGDKREKQQIVTRHLAEELSCKGIKVLVAEDNPVNQKLIKVLLKKLGCIADLVNNGEEAVEKLKHEKYDMILMDLMMPVMGGLEATKIIKKDLGIDPPPIIALTASTMKQDKENCFESGMDDFLSKPIDPKSLKEKLVKWGRHKP